MRQNIATTMIFGGMLAFASACATQSGTEESIQANTQDQPQVTTPEEMTKTPSEIRSLEALIAAGDAHRKGPDGRPVQGADTDPVTADDDLLPDYKSRYIKPDTDTETGSE